MVFNFVQYYIRNTHKQASLPIYISVVVVCICKAIPHLLLLDQSSKLEHFCKGHLNKYATCKTGMCVILMKHWTIVTRNCTDASATNGYLLQADADVIV